MTGLRRGLRLRVAAAGDCDACPVLAGVTTEDEMFILLGAYYLP